VLTPASVHARRVELSCITESLYSTVLLRSVGYCRKLMTLFTTITLTATTPVFVDL